MRLILLSSQSRNTYNIFMVNNKIVLVFIDDYKNLQLIIVELNNVTIIISRLS